MRKPGSIVPPGSRLLFLLFDDQPAPSLSREGEDESLPHLRNIAWPVPQERPFHDEHSLKYSQAMHCKPGDGT